MFHISCHDWYSKYSIYMLRIILIKYMIFKEEYALSVA
jgi:hypothetical protein